MRKISLVLLLVIAISLCGAQAPAPPALPPQAAEFLPRGVTLTPGAPLLFVDSGRGPGGALRTPALDAAARGAGAAPEALSFAGLRIEALAFLPAASPPYAQSGAAPGAQPGGPAETLRALNRILNSVRTMQGLEYWSASRKRMRTLYAEAYRIESPASRRPLPDPESPPSAPGVSLSFYAYLRDLTFGGNVMNYTVKVGSSSIAISSENAATVKYFLIPLVAPGGMKCVITIVPCREGLVVHLLSTIEAGGVMENRIFESAGNKALALLGWFARETAAAGITKDSRLQKNIEDVPRIK